MRNRHPGTCYRCGLHCAKGHGHFERHNGGWRVQHASCAIEARKEKIMITELHDKMAQLQAQLATAQQAEQRLNKLRHAMGYWQDGSGSIVTLYQDDASFAYHVRVGNVSQYATSFEQLLDNLPEVQL